MACPFCQHQHERGAPCGSCRCYGFAFDTTISQASSKTPGGDAEPRIRVSVILELTRAQIEMARITARAHNLEPAPWVQSLVEQALTTRPDLSLF